MYHASFGGGAHRRHFCLNLCRQATTAAELDELDRWIIAKGAGALPSREMLAGAGEEGMRHLRQVEERARLLEAEHPDLRGYAR